MPSDTSNIIPWHRVHVRTGTYLRAVQIPTSGAHTDSVASFITLAFHRETEPVATRLPNFFSSRVVPDMTIQKSCTHHAHVTFTFHNPMPKDIVYEMLLCEN